MPLPLLLIGGAVLLFGGAGAAAHVSAAADRSKAKNLADDIESMQEKLKKRKSKLEEAQEEAQQILADLGTRKTKFYRDQVPRIDALVNSDLAKHQAHLDIHDEVLSRAKRRFALPGYPMVLYMV